MQIAFIHQTAGETDRLALRLNKILSNEMYYSRAKCTYQPPQVMKISANIPVNIIGNRRILHFPVMYS